MNTDELRAAMARKHIGVAKLATRIGIGKKAFYAKMDRKSDFKQREISAIGRELDLSSDELLAIFFADEVS